MRHRTVGELMTSTVVRVQPGTSFKEIAQLLQEYDITAVCVVDAEDRPLGVVSEADLLRKQTGWLDPGDPAREAGTGSGGGGTRRRTGPGDADAAALDRAKAEATTAEGLMTSPALCARPQWTVVEAARVMQDHGVKRLPVTDEAGRVTGIVSRSDLLRVFLRQDRSVSTEIVEDVLTRTLGEAPSAVGVTVDNGRVLLTGAVSRRSVVPVLVRMCRTVDGVVSVDERLTWEADDTGAMPGDGVQWDERQEAAAD